MKIAVQAYLDNNLGDDLMVKLMADRFPEHLFVLYSDSTVIRETFRRFGNIEVKSNTERKKDLKSIDAFIKIGGSMFQFFTLRDYLSRIRSIIRLKKMKREGILTVVLGCNLGPYSNKFGIKLTEWELRYNDLITVRDDYSYNLVKTFKKISNFYLADDIVYNYKNSSKVTQNSGLGISAYRSSRSKENNIENYKALAMVSDIYISQTNKKVYLFAFDSEKENDLSAAHHILNLSKNKEHIEIVPYIGNHEVFLNKFMTCEKMISIRFHSAILADIFKIPFLPVAYSNKMVNFIKDRKFNGEIIDIKDLNMNIDFENIIKNIFSEELLFQDFLGDKSTSHIHFEKLSEIFE